MRRFSASNVLTALTVLAGAMTAIAAALDEPRTQGIALGASVVFVSLLIRSVARDSNRAGARRAKALEANSDQVAKARRAVDKGLEKLDRRIEKLDKRIERESTRTALRVLSDLNAARLEQIDALHPASGGEN